MSPDDYYKGIGFSKLTEVQEKNKLSDRNTLILSPCGSGKTEAGHSKLLVWDKKSIFVEPMHTLATSIQNRLNKYHNMLNIKDKWTIQHSTIGEDKFLNSNYCVTTIDQVLSGWLGIGRQSFIRGKNVVKSNFVFDEVQLLQLDKTLLTTINMLDTLYEHGNKFVIMTATMPKYFTDFLEKRYEMDLIIVENECVENRKIYVNYTEKLDFNKINSIDKKQIIICNTQEQQEKVYNEITDKSRCIILNSKLLNTDRKKVEDEVNKYFDKDSEENNKILITTQIVEAGIDISASYLYSYGCPIDNFIQRCGRCARWGGIGYVIIVDSVYDTDNNDSIYNKAIVKDTLAFFKDNQGIEFTWSIQKKCINEILNDYYKKYINEESINKNKNKLTEGSRNDLIRDIKNVNLIVAKNISVDSFNKESVNISINKLKKLSKNNEIYILHKREITPVPFKDELIGETIVIKGNDCIYDELGFRYKENYICNDFEYDSKNKLNLYDFIDYKEETWIQHAISTMTLMKIKLKEDRFSGYTIDNCDKIALLGGGMHDLGKLDVVWQGPHWANTQDGCLPLAHFPYRIGNPTLFTKRKHNHIGAYLLKKYIDKILFNVILQHHGRIIWGEDIKIKEFELHKFHTLCIRSLGFQQNIENIGDNIKMSYKEILTPRNAEWNDFIYIVGTLMESDIEAIKLFHNS